VQPNVGHYCELLEYNCPQPNLQFALKSQCTAIGNGYNSTDADANRNKNINSLGCREYHAQAARSNAAVHCEHAGPTGAGVCGTRAQAWGNILAAAPCLDSHVNTLFRLGLGDANVDTLIPPTSGAVGTYNTTFDNAGNTQICRIYHLGVATTDNSHCAHGFVSGGDSCGTLTANLCAFIGSICTFGTNASYQYASSAACVTALTNSTTNLIGAGKTGTAGAGDNSFECRFYHAMVAGSFMTGGSNAAVAGAAATKQYHCGHTLMPSQPGGCGAAASVAPTPKSMPGSASTLSLVGSLAIMIAGLFAL